MNLRTKLIIAIGIMILIPVAAVTMLLTFGIPEELNLPEWQDVIPEMIVLLFLVLVITAMMLVAWIRQGITTPIIRLTEATKKIKEGNLDFELEVTEAGEIGDLSRSFEEMRLRLKESSEEKLISERESKDLIRNISHDLKTPITAIKGYAEGLLDGVADTPMKRDKYLRTIQNKADEMTALINELTLYSQIDTNRIPYNFAKLPVRAYFEDAAGDIRTDLETQGIRFSYKNKVPEPVTVIADPEQLTRVIGNIIQNSVKYLDKKEGWIELRVADIGDFIQVEIEDNGRGISRESLPHIFDRFYRTDESRNSGTGGSGIGLSIVRKILEDHGGRIWATSVPGSGTTMYFVLRKAAITEEEPSEQGTDH